MAKVEVVGEMPDVTHDQLLDQIEQRAKDEYARQSDAAESGAKLKEFIEKTSMNTQGFSWLKAIVKKLPKKDGQSKAMDVIRTLEIGLPMIKDHVMGQGTSEMDLPEPSADVQTPEENEEMSEQEVEALHQAMDEADDEDTTVEHVDFHQEETA